MNMSKKEVEQLRLQAIKAEEIRVTHIYTFLNDLPLNSEVNKAVALELATSIGFIEKNIDKLKGLKAQ